jgi:predicted nucleic acid-binding protein
MRALLDTSILIADRADLMPEEGAISAASIAELHFGVQVAASADERARRLARLGAVEAEFDPVPIDAAVARGWGTLAAAAMARGLRPRRRAMDLLIAATAHVLAVPLLTLDADLAPLADIFDIRVVA